MTETWRQSMSLGLVHFMAWPTANSDAEQLISTVTELASDEFFDVMEVRRSDFPGAHAQIRAIAEQSGTKIGVGAQPLLLGGKLSLNDLDSAGRQAAVDEVKRSIDASYEMGARICACLSGPGSDNEDDNKRMLDAMVASCVELCRYAQEKADGGEPVWLSVEQFDHSVDKKCLIGSSAITAELAERVRAEVSNFGITADLSHVPILHEDVHDLVSILAPYIIHLHAGNAVATEGLEAYGDMHPRFDFPGGSNGVEELKEYLNTLIYAGVFENEVPTDKMVFTFEVKPVGSESTALILAHTKRTFLRAWAEL
ncbi:sugar phosphate isomerase/epimerase [bacterium]|nr:sugar phosphate isomerase/epimerase [bacterium]